MMDLEVGYACTEVAEIGCIWYLCIVRDWGERIEKVIRPLCMEAKADDSPQAALSLGGDMVLSSHNGRTLVQYAQGSRSLQHVR